MQNQSNTERLTEREAADEVRRTPETLKRWRRLRKGPPFIRLQGRVLYDRAKLNAWLASQEVPA